MAHGFGTERNFRLPAYAEHFARSGLAVLLFDYRTFGESEGEPRYWVDPGRHLLAWKATIAHARAFPEIDGRKPALWGTSYGGGHVIVTYCRARHIRRRHRRAGAVCRRVVFDHARRSAASAPGNAARAAPCRQVGPRPRPALHQACSCSGTVRGTEHTPESLLGVLSIVPDPTQWENKCRARILFKFPTYRTLNFASRVKCPALLMLGEKDSLIAPNVVREAARRMANPQLISYPFGHFDIYTGEGFEDAVTKQAAFLVHHLRG